MTTHKDIFCAIAQKEAASYVIVENDLAIAILDREPATEGHTLVIPKRHVNDIFDISNDEILSVFSLAQEVSKILKNTFNYQSIILHEVNGEGAQDVRHFHLHVYGGPKVEPYFYQKFNTQEELQFSLEHTRKIMTASN